MNIMFQTYLISVVVANVHRTHEKIKVSPELIDKFLVIRLVNYFWFVVP